MNKPTKSSWKTPINYIYLCIVVILISLGLLRFALTPSILYKKGDLDKKLNFYNTQSHSTSVQYNISKPILLTDNGASYVKIGRNNIVWVEYADPQNDEIYSFQFDTSTNKAIKRKLFNFSYLFDFNYIENADRIRAYDLNILDNYVYWRGPEHIVYEYNPNQQKITSLPLQNIYNIYGKSNDRLVMQTITNKEATLNIYDLSTKKTYPFESTTMDGSPLKGGIFRDDFFCFQSNDGSLSVGNTSTKQTIEINNVHTKSSIDDCTFHYLLIYSEDYYSPNYIDKYGPKLTALQLYDITTKKMIFQRVGKRYELLAGKIDGDYLYITSAPEFKEVKITAINIQTGQESLVQLQNKINPVFYKSVLSDMWDISGDTIVYATDATHANIWLEKIKLKPIIQ